MKILKYLQLSRAKEGKYVMSADSNFIFGKNICKILIELGHQVDLIIPYEHQRYESNKEIQKLLDCDVKLLEINYADDVFGSRFYFNKDLVNICRRSKYDIIWSNDMCLSQNFKIFAAGKPKIISYQHWQDSFNVEEKKSPENFTYCYRQGESAEISDILLFNSNFAIENFKNEVGFMIKNFNAKCFKFHPIASESVGRDYSNRIKILFNHRLSSQKSYLDNFINFCKIVDGLDVDVTICNAENKVPKFKIPDNFKVVNSGSIESYNNVLKSCNTQLNCFMYKAMWNMGVVDAIVNSQNTLMLSHSGFKEICPSESYSHCKDLDDMRHKLEILIQNPQIFEEENARNLCFAENTYGYAVSKHKLEDILSTL